MILASGADLQSPNPLVTAHPLARQVQRYALLVTLVRYDSLLQPEPYLAQAWEWSADSTIITFHLFPGLRWHDRVRTTAYDVAWTLEAARDRIFVGPALGLTYNLSQAAGQWGVTAERARAFQRELEVSVEAVARMRKRGIRVLPGGDYGFPPTPHGTYARDLWLFVKILGFQPMEALVAATRLGGELSGHAGRMRTP